MRWMLTLSVVLLLPMAYVKRSGGDGVQFGTALFWDAEHNVIAWIVEMFEALKEVAPVGIVRLKAQREVGLRSIENAASSEQEDVSFYTNKYQATTTVSSSSSPTKKSESRLIRYTLYYAPD
ncbi:uncharacterized protein CCR75_003255 [Bremia lactucae]|uniref:Uncharacterized protein n=1 Tax=Bremia lactucae TaxID=4779 RepID=A0A976IJ11_BRELC|nr:hypothetical protein CCR75_003255 [Bremia lactucae]